MTGVRIDPERCCCSGNCELAQPELFVVPDDGGAAVVLPAAAEPGRWDDVLEAAASCPTGAIVVEAATESVSGPGL